MRTIKFRGKRLIDGKWIYGVPYLDGGWHIMIDSNTATPEEGTGSWSIDPATVGQFTGLTDKNYKEIFEGDILRSFHFKDGNKINYLYHIVEWCDRLTGWLARNTSNLQYDPAQNGNPQLWVYVKNADFEVIGNIHDDQELLKNE